MAIQLIETLAGEFDPSKYHDEYQDKLKAIIKAKAKGKKVELPEVEERESTKVLDLVSRLEASLAASGSGRTAKKATKKAAKKSAAKKGARKRKTA